MRDREGGDAVDFGISHRDSTPKIAATFIGNMTTILANVTPGGMRYSIANEPATVHDLLLQKSDGTFYLAVWDERVPGTATDDVTVDLGATFSSAECTIRRLEQTSSKYSAMSVLCRCPLAITLCSWR